MAPRLSPTRRAALQQCATCGWVVSPHHPQQPGAEAHLLIFPTEHYGAIPHHVKQLLHEVFSNLAADPTSYANSMQHTATTIRHSSDNIEPCNQHSTFVISLFCHTRPALGVPRLPTIERAALQLRATFCPVHGQQSEHLPFCEAPVRKFLPGPPGAIHGPWSHCCCAAPATEFPQHWTTRSPAPFARTIPSANETVTTMLSQVSRVRNLNQTFCMQIISDNAH